MIRHVSAVVGVIPPRPAGGATSRRKLLALTSAAAMAGLVGWTTPAAAGSPPASHAMGFRQVNLVSDQLGVAPLHDPDLVNPWGLSATPGTDAAPGSPLWVSDNGTDKTTLYTGGSVTTVAKAALVVDVTSGAPTGQVFN